jgi:TPR repeat protein
MKTKTLLMKTKTLLMSRAAALPPFMKTKTFLMSSAAALALLISAVAVAFLSSGDSELCTSELAQGAYESAFPYCEKACSKDDGGGCARLGELYDKGRGVKKDYQQAKKLLRKSLQPK